MEFIIAGIVREEESKRPIPGLLVCAFDKDQFFSDLLGNEITDSNGKFSMCYEGNDFQELFEKQPDIYLDIFDSATARRDPDRARNKPIYTTQRHVRFKAGCREFFGIEIPRDQLGEDAPGTVIVSTPEPGEWKSLIDEFINENPGGFQPDPERGFMAPRLHCTSDKGWRIRRGGVGEHINVVVEVTNKGNGVSFNTYVEAYEGPIGYTHPLRDYLLGDYKIITINPGQKVRVPLHWPRMLPPRGNRIVGVCFDPFLDPRGFHLVERYNDHITQIRVIPI